MRNIKFEAYVETGPRGRWIESEGYFHQWGSKIKFEGDEPFALTYGIVEDIEGTIYEVEPDKITFLDSPN